MKPTTGAYRSHGAVDWMERSLTWKIPTCCLVVLILGACYPKYSPPIRALYYASPGRTEQKRLQVASAYLPVAGGSATLDYAPSDHISVETGGDFLFAAFGTASLGLRIRPWPAVRQQRKVQLLNDLEAGFGLGAGGEFECDEEEDCVSDNLEWYDRFAYGAYIGTGIGIGFTYWKASERIIDIDLYARVRMSFAKATGAPYTTWVIWGPGIQVRVLRFVRIWYFFPFDHHWNRYETITGYCYGELGVGFTFQL